jgi:D-alanyl-D-alanine carboxypeptidase/D-alanyl-D-alanine-endopeptidase (penicillin-binding protein 4)
MPRIALLLVAAALSVAACAPSALARGARSSDAGLAARLASAMRGAGAHSGAYVVNSTQGTAVFRWRERKPRILASNTKLFTTSTVLARYGAGGTLGTEVQGQGTLEAGTWRGNLYLRGGGDPSFGSAVFGRRNYGGTSSVEDLAAKLGDLGLERVSGAIYGDESRFDSRRGTAATGWHATIDLGPLSGLAFNRGLSSEGGFGFQSNPPAFAASRLRAALKARGIKVSKGSRAGRAPAGSQVLASEDSPPMSRLIRITNKPSDNYFAEMLLKDVALQAYGKGTTGGGARLVSGFARRLGAGAHLTDGSGLSRADRASPYRVVRLLLAMQKRVEYQAFYDSLSIAGRDGTLAPRMRRGPARSRCRGKTGTLSDVSALSGYCRARSGDVYVFSILMNGANPYGARAIQDRMAQALAGVRG